MSDDLGSSPFEVDIGWNPRFPVDLFCMDTSIESVNDLKKRLSSALVDARFSHHISKARQSAYTARKYRPANYKVGDKV